MFNNNDPFRSYILNTNSTLIYNAEDFDIVMPMYNLLEYSQNYSMTSESLWNYYRDKIDDVDDQIQIKIRFNHHDQQNHQYLLETQKSLPLIYLSNFSWFLEVY